MASLTPRLGIIALLAAASAVPSSSAPAPIEYAVKAAYIVKFASYVAWPSGVFADPAAPLVLCVAASESIGGLIAQAAKGQAAGGHPVVVRRNEHLDRDSGCHIAVLGGAPDLVAQNIAALADAPVATVTDARDAGPVGMFHFEVVGGRVRFHIDQMTAADKRLAISSKLLALAISVRKQVAR